MYMDHSISNWAALLTGSVIGVVVLFILLVVFAVGIVFYIIRALGLYRIAQARGYENAWLAWIPIASDFLLGWVGDDIVEKSGRQSWNMRWWILGGMACALVSWIPVAGLILALGPMAAAVIEYFALYEIYQHYTPENKVLYLVLSIVISICSPIFLFLIGRKTVKQ